MALLNLALILGLIAAQDVAAGGYSPWSVPGAMVIALPFALGGLLHGVARLLAHTAGRDPLARRQRASHLTHTAALVLALLYFVEPIRGLPAVLRLVSGSGVATWAGCLLALAALHAVVTRLPARLVGAVLACSLSTALAVAVGEAALKRRAAASRPLEASADLPNVYYIVLDSQAGFAAFPSFLPAALVQRDAMRADYLEAGFEVYERVYTNHYWTDRSLYSLLDNRLHDKAPPTRAGTIQMPANALFDAFLSKGYRPRIHDSSYLNLCGAAAAYDPSCLSYPAHNLASNTPSPQELGLVLNGLASRLIADPHRADRRRIFSAINSAAAFDALIADVASHPRGQFVFAHLLIPHEPFVLDAHCALRDGAVRDFEAISQHAKIGLAEAKERWRDYLAQAACAHDRVLRLVDALKRAGVYEESTIVVHGDHGSRISVAGWRPRQSEIGGRLFLDFYVPLFALKRGDYPLGPGTSAGRTDWASLSVVLAELMGWKPPAGTELLRRNDPRVRYTPRLDEAQAILSRGATHDAGDGLAASRAAAGRDGNPQRKPVGD